MVISEAAVCCTAEYRADGTGPFGAEAPDGCLALRFARETEE